MKIYGKNSKGWKFSPALTVTGFVGCEESGHGGGSLITDHVFAKKITK